MAAFTAPRPRSFTFERTSDLELVKSIITHPAIYQGSKDDFSPPPQECDVPESSAQYILTRLDGEIIGLFALEPHSVIVWEVHTCLLPAVWGEDAAAAAKALLEWIWGNTPCIRLVTKVPACNRTALAFARKAGMVQYGLNPHAFKKSGRYWPVFEMGITSPFLKTEDAE